MKRLLATAAALLLAAPAQFAQAPPAPTARTTVEEVVLDLIVRDKKGKPLTDLTQEELTVTDNGARQKLTSFRLVRGKEAINSKGVATSLEPLQQIRLVTLAFDALAAADARKTARTAAGDLVRGDQGTNVFYSVVMINTRLLALQAFTRDKEALVKAIERATSGLAANTFTSESDAIQAELKRTLGGQTVNGADQDVNLLSAASQTAAGAGTSGSPSEGGAQFVQAKLASVMLDMLRFDSSVGAQGARMSLDAFEGLVRGLRPMPGRKSVLYFSQGLYVTPELDVPFRRLMSDANRFNVTFYALDTRGVMTTAQNRSATAQLNGAARASNDTMLKTSGPVTKDQVMASDNAEISARSNVQLAIRDLAESTGGFLISDSNDLRGPVQRVSEEIASYYEVTFDPAIKNYDGSFRKLAVTSSRKDLVIHARSGYFALPPDVRGTGLEPFELPLLKSISSGTLSSDVEFRAAAVMLKPSAEARDVTVIVEIPLRTLQTKPGAGKNASVHFSLAALVKGPNGDVLQKLTRERSLQITPEQAKGGNFSDKVSAALAGGNYTLETAVMDLESGKTGIQRSQFTVPVSAKGVGISSLTAIRSFTPNAKDLAATEPFQFQKGAIAPTLNNAFSKAPDSALRLFFTVYPDTSNPAKSSIEIEFIQSNKLLQKAPMPLASPEADGRIPMVITIPTSAIPAGEYLVRATAHQGDTTAQSSTTVKIEAQ